MSRVLTDNIQTATGVTQTVKDKALDTLPNRYPPLLSTSDLPYPASGASRLDS
jgi:hypothetical protein